jgi:phosphoglucosamine mutase
MSDISTTGDGILTAIMLTEEMLDTKSRLSELCRGLIIYPKRTESVRVKDKYLASHDEDVSLFTSTLMSENREALRILVRESGTEPKVRIMVEAKTQFECDGITDGIISILRSKGYIDE